MGAAASTIPDKVTEDQFRTLAGGRYDQAYFDASE
jgi:hypothetical protein